jgi:hypothetical protein
VNQSPQGLEAIMAALATGGQPMGNIAQAPNPMLPNTGQPIPQMPAMPQGGAMGAVDPLQAGLAEMDPQMLQIILQAMAQGGLFNQQPPVG